MTQHDVTDRSATHRLMTQAIPVRELAVPPELRDPADSRRARRSAAGRGGSSMSPSLPSAPSSAQGGPSRTDSASGDAESRPRRGRARRDSPVRPVILGILNVTPDSFSDGGSHDDVASAVEFAARMVADGADIIDVGGESTRPGAERIPIDEEQRRVLPVVTELVRRGVPVSVDTMNAWTAEAAAGIGAAIINDVSAGTADPDMARVIADSEVMFIAMHSRGPSATMNDRAVYRDTVADVRRELEYRIATLITAGVDSDRIVVDPGLGFAKNAEQNWEILGGLRDIGGLGHPVLVGASRKRFLADLLPSGAPMRRRDAATAVISALAADAGAWGVRVHDVASTRAALDVWCAVNGVRS